MPVQISNPGAGTAQAPTRVPPQFVVLGTKAGANEIPLALMVSVDGNGNPDGEFQVAGRLFAPTPVPPATEWTAYFQMPPGIHRGRRFCLLAFDSAGLTGAPPVNVMVDKKDFVLIKKDQRARPAPGGARNFDGNPGAFLEILGIQAPQTGATGVPRNNFVAYGNLPLGEQAVNGNLTVVVATNDANNVTKPNGTWTDGYGFWYLRFPTINNANTVNLTVAYSPNGAEDESTNIGLV